MLVTKLVTLFKIPPLSYTLWPLCTEQYQSCCHVDSQIVLQLWAKKRGTIMPGQMDRKGTLFIQIHLDLEFYFVCSAIILFLWELVE